MLTAWVRAGFRVAEIGAGTGGLTSEAFKILDTNSHSEMLSYVASDISHVWAPQLLEAVGSQKCKFEVRDARDVLADCNQSVAKRRLVTSYEQSLPLNLQAHHGRD